MQIFHDLNEWRLYRRSQLNSLTIGFVPTMGNLHAGHASLVNCSKQENDLTVVSIFINPTQFNQVNDFNAYPRTLEADLKLLEELEVDGCILPTEQAMYQGGYRYSVVENKLGQLMEGRQRPGHFDGVLTVVLKLLNLVEPHSAYFGEKDYQQYSLIKAMASAFFLDIIIKCCPTIRESSGLAFSSRNNRLTSVQKIEAENFATIFHQDKSCELIIRELEEEGVVVEYIMDYESRRYAAVTIGDIRLIDNYSLIKS